MGKIIKAICILIVAFFIVVTTGSMDNKKTYAGGGINYKVTVSNPTDKKCRVCLMVEKLTFQEAKETVTLSPGDSHTWETGALCPCGLEGKVYDTVGKEWRLMECINMYGHKANCNGVGMVAVCASHSFTIERKTGVTEVRDYDYGFRKN